MFARTAQLSAQPAGAVARAYRNAQICSWPMPSFATTANTHAAKQAHKPEPRLPVTTS